MTVILYVGLMRHEKRRSASAAHMNRVSYEWAPSGMNVYKRKEHQKWQISSKP